MSSATNNVTLVGRVAQDPKTADANGNAVLEFAVAVDTKKKGEKDADFFDCVIYGNYAETMAEYMAKGRLIAVSGRMRQDRWKTDDGSNRSRVRVIVESLQLLDSKNKDDGPDTEDDTPDF